MPDIRTPGFVVALVAAVALALPASLARAETPMLTLSNAALNGAEATVELSESDIEALPQGRISTRTEWTDGLTVFEGPLARDVLALIARGDATVARAVAVNDYSVDIPLEDLDTYGVLFAISMNGERLSMRDKGPIWIVYPRDDFEELQDPVYNGRWIWQLVRVELK